MTPSHRAIEVMNQLDKIDSNPELSLAEKDRLKIAAIEAAIIAAIEADKERDFPTQQQ